MKKILLVEDDEKLQRIYQKWFKSEGYDVITASDGETGLALAKSEKPNLILLDIMLPGHIQGIELLESIKSNPEIRSIIVVMLTNLDDKVLISLEKGATWYFIKVNTESKELMAKVNELLSNNN